MQKLILILIALLSFSGMSAQQSVKERFSTTPFVYKDFKEAEVQFTLGSKSKTKANIFLRDASLIFLNGNTKMKANLFNVFKVTFGNTVYRKVGDKLAKVLAEKNGNCLVELTTIDVEAIREAERKNENTGFLDLPEFNIFIETEGDYYGDTRTPKFPLKVVYYFIKDGDPVLAGEGKIKKVIRKDKKNDFKELMKDRFWSWKDAKSLEVLLDYL